MVLIQLTSSTLTSISSIVKTLLEDEGLTMWYLLFDFWPVFLDTMSKAQVDIMIAMMPCSTQVFIHPCRCKEWLFGQKLHQHPTYQVSQRVCSAHNLKSRPVSRCNHNSVDAVDFFLGRLGHLLIALNHQFTTDMPMKQVPVKGRW